MIFAFFPCTRFENQILLSFRGERYQDKRKTVVEKLERNILLQNQLTQLYCYVTKLALVCIQKGLRLIIENPYSKESYLHTHWCLRPAIIDTDRRRRGDYYKKPTQYFFIGHEPKTKFLPEALTVQATSKLITHTWDKVERSLIAPEYAERFIKEFIL